MKKITAAAAAGLTAVTVSVALVGCGAATDTKATEGTDAAESTSQTSAAADGDDRMTLNQYVEDNEIAETPFQAGDPGTPKIDFPFPPDWVSAGDKTPEWAYGAIVYDKADDPEDPPYMYAIASKLTGDVDPAKILRYAPTQLNDLPEFTPLGEPEKDSLGGFEAVNYIGSYVRDGKPRSVGQQTVVIPGKDALFVLQINAESPKGQEQSVIDAFTIISDKTTITVPS